jgi:hypothetical protein
LKTPTFTKQTVATVTAIHNCDSNTNCVISYDIKVDDKVYSQSKVTVSKKYATGQEVKVLYDPSNPDNHDFNPFPVKIVGWILLAVSIFILIAVWVWYFIARRYKLAAAASGVDAVTDIIN